MKNKKIKSIIGEFEKKGWYLKRRNGKHLIYSHENGGTVTIAITASDHNAHWSVRRHFRKEESLWNSNSKKKLKLNLVGVF